MRRFRFNLLFAGGWVVSWALLDWLVTAASSPLHPYLLDHPGPANLWGSLHLGPVVLGSLVSGNVHQPSAAVTLAASALQWFAVGLAASFLVRRPGGASPLVE